MAASSNLERLSANTPDGCLALGMHREIIQSVGATYTLSNEESGALCEYDRAAGVVYTLPSSPNEGCWFEFMATVTVTSNAYKVITAGSKYILGTVFGYTTDATEIDGFSADGSTHVAISSNGSTTGGVIGTRYILTYDGTRWLVTGHTFCGTATPADPFATS